MIRLITLDLDNTLWDLSPVLIRAEKTLKDWVFQHIPQGQLFYSPENLRALRKTICQENPPIAHFKTALRKEILLRCFLQAGLNANTARQQSEQAFSIFYKERNNVTFFPETKDILKTLSNHYPLIALTNGNASIELISIEKYFVAHYSAESVGKPKPYQDMFIRALQHVQCSPQSALHIGDHPLEDIQAAQAVGMKTIWLNKNHQLPSNSCQPDVEIATLTNLLELVQKLNNP